MPPLLKKEELFKSVLEAIKDGGWKVYLLNKLENHPLRIKITNNGNEECVVIYIWNITHGGKTRSPEEFRIQITSVDKLEFEENFKTLLLGRAEIEGQEIFVAFNPKKHSSFGFSPSLQVKKKTLEEAIMHGVAFQEKSRSSSGEINEVVIAFSSDYILEYILDVYPEYHIEAEKEIINTEADVILKNPLDVKISPEELKEIPKERKRVIDKINRAVRDRRFRKNIFVLYKGKCAMCGLQANLTEASHIIPIPEGGTDEATNGVLLCRNHHKAYDSGLIGINKDYTIIQNERYSEELRRIHQDNKLNLFLEESRIGETIFLPDEESYYPKKEYLDKRCRLDGI